ncbi:MAG: septation protein A [Neisseriaceae bacterium]|nr:septation protein A [Neisseriaceae bacterium]
MKLLLNILALLLFFGAYFLTHDIFIATILAVVAGIIQASITFLMKGKMDIMQSVSLALIIIFGGLTVVLQNDWFIKFKPTALFWLVSLSMLFGSLTKKNILRAIMGKEIKLPDHIWNEMMWVWTVFFALLGASNLWVAWNFSTDTWVTYKVFGVMGLMGLFFIAQAVYMQGVLNDMEKHKKAQEEQTAVQ